MKKLITGITLLTSVAFFGQTNSLNSTGNAGIGTTSPSAKLHVVGNGLATGANSTAILTLIEGKTSSTGNVSKLSILNKRSAVGSNWNKTSLRLQRTVDATPMAFIDFGIENKDYDYGLAFGTGSEQETRMVIEGSGNVGIGTQNPSAGLEIFKGNTNDLALSLKSSGLGWGSGLQFDNTSSGNKYGIYSGSDEKWHFTHEGSGDRLVINSVGNIGIGSANPDSKLTVKGKIHCEEVQVDLDVPADYVFEKYYTGASELKESYTMPTLEEVEAYTKENHHLPNVPSAKTIQEEGLHLKAMTNLLLQKIEELTLYTIEQNKELKTLKEKVTQLENK